MNLNSVTVTQMADIDYNNWSQSDHIDPEPTGEVQIDNVVNIREVKNCKRPPYDSRKSGTFVYPDIILDTPTGSKRVPTGHIEDYSSLTPNVEVTLIEDEAASDERHTIETYSAYGIWEYTWIDDTFETEHSSVVIKIPSEEHGVVNYSPMYRGIMAKFKDGSVEYFGNFERHSGSYKRKFEDGIYTPPVESDSNSFTVTTEKGVFTDVVNIRRDRSFTFALQREDSSCVYVSEIFDVKGSLYTVCVKHEDTFENAKYKTTAFKRCTGVYHSDDKLYMVGYPESASVHKSPNVKSIKLNKIQSLHIKTPSGEIIDSAPEYVIHETGDIPDVQGRLIPDNQISTDMPKEDMRNILICRMGGLLDITDAPESDFVQIITAYPELESVLKGLTETQDIFKYYDVLPYDFSRSELVEIVKEAKQLQPSMDDSQLTADGEVERDMPELEPA